MCLKLFVASCDIYIVIYSDCDVCCDIYVICNACDIYVVIWGPLYVKNKKKNLFGHFDVCQGLGTRQSDHMASPGHQVRRVPKPCTRRTDHSSPCALGKGTRRIWELCRVPGVRAHGESGSFAVCLPSGHTANLGALPCACRPGTRRTAADAVSWP